MVMSSKDVVCCNKNGEPRVAYSSEREAKNAAEDYRRNRISIMVSYKCKNCGKWHLSPKNHNTPSIECEYCRKQLYSTKKVAENRAKIIWEKRKENLNVYECPVYNGFHLTHKVGRMVMA